MTKQDFLTGLEQALSGEVSRDVFLENVTYYRDYIDGEIRKGRREEEVLEELGSPRLIARTIIDAAQAEAEEDAGFSGQDIFRREAPYGEYEEYDDGRGNRGTGGFRVFHAGSAGCLWILAIAVLLLILVFTMVVRFVYAFPWLVVIGIVLYIWHRRNRGGYW